MLKIINNVIKKIIHKWFFTYDFDIKLLEGGKNAPMRTYKKDAGYDLVVNKSVKIPVGEMVNVPTGVACKSYGVPAWIFLTGRSSTLLRHGIVVDNGIIDDGFTGELFVKVFNITKKVVWLRPDMRIGQMIVIPHTNCKFSFINEFRIKKHERGNNGFGSTGI